MNVKELIFIAHDDALGFRFCYFDLAKSSWIAITLATS
jgi:hypothetical protein